MKTRTRLENGDVAGFVSTIKEVLSSFPSIAFAYLYGSALESLVVGDVDIAVYFEAAVPPEGQIDMTLSLSANLSAKLGLEVDVRTLNQSPVGYRFEVTGGELLFSRDEHLRSEFVERTWQEYFDFKPQMEQNLRDLLAP
ncbi:MAG TPA: nucleotidyltransferase domain-containing protein [Clostridiales bacterium UBA8153]|nr:nucleotidyltransferase domain-containing protein [Clostridiales bacterium UBA8153]